MEIISNEKLMEIAPAVVQAVEAKGFDASFLGLLGMDKNHFTLVDKAKQVWGLGQLNRDGSIAVIVPLNR